MDINVQSRRVDCKHDKVSGIGVFRHQFGVGPFDGGRQTGMFYEPLVDKYILFASCAFDVFGFADIAENLDGFCILFNAVKPLVISVSENAGNTLGQISGAEVV